jgi:multimeric flavodoxin WrbA
MSYVLAFSGTPIKGGTIEKGLKMVLGAVGAERNELVRLADLDMRFCLACQRCAPTNRCVLNDGVNPLLEKIEAADAVIMSGYASFGSLNALSKVFVERIWPLRNNLALTRGKTGAAVAGGSVMLDEIDAYFRSFFEGYLGMSFQGTLKLRGNLPSTTFGCVEGGVIGGLFRELGIGTEDTPDKLYDPERDPEARAKARELGVAVAASIASAAFA